MKKKRLRQSIIIYILCFGIGFMAFELYVAKNEVSVLQKDIKTLHQRLDQVLIETHQLGKQIEDWWLAKEEQQTEHELTLEEILLCGSDHGSFKSYMDYRCITDSSSAQYKLIYGDKIIVGDDGLLYSGEYVGVALGTR